MAAIKKIKIQQQGFTVREMKAFLQGIDALQGGKDWSPDVQQWKRIREKIDNLVETEIVAQPVEAIRQPIRPVVAPPPQMTYEAPIQVPGPPRAPIQAPTYEQAIPVPPGQDPEEFARIQQSMRQNMHPLAGGRDLGPILPPPSESEFAR